VNTGARWVSPQAVSERVLGIQRKLHKWASDDRDRGFSDLHNLVRDPATLLVAWRRVRGNRGSRPAGIDGQTAYEIEVRLGVQRSWVSSARSFARGPFGRWRSRSARSPSAAASCANWGSRRSATASCGPPSSSCWSRSSRPTFGRAPTGSGRGAERRTRSPRCGTSPSAPMSGSWRATSRRALTASIMWPLMGRVRERVEDKRVLRLVKAFLHAGILRQHGGLDRSVTGTPQGGVLTAPTQ
jgi:RNA-directed DNA polymerase